MNAQTLISRYRERLAWSAGEALDVLSEFIDRNELTDSLKKFLTNETGIAVFDDDDTSGYRGKPFAVVAYQADSDLTGEPDERIDTESEVLALEAFSELLNRPDLEQFAVLQFNPGSDSRRELLRYDRRTSVTEW